MTDKLDPVRARLAAAEDIEFDDVPPQDSAEWNPADDDPGPGEADRQTPDPSGEAEVELPPLARAAMQPLNDYGNAQRFIIHFGTDIMFVPRVGWFTWSDMHWAKDTDLLDVRGRAQQIWSLIEKEAEHIRPTDKERALMDEGYSLRRRQRELDDIGALDEEQREEHQRNEGRLAVIAKKLTAYNKKIGTRMTFAKDAGNAGRMDRMISEAQTGKAVAFEKLDSNPYEVNTATGLLRFSVTAPPDKPKAKLAEVDVLAHDRRQLQTKLIDVAYSPHAPCEKFDTFLTRIQPHREMREFIQRWFGLSLLGLKTSNMAVFYGNGANGKSVLVDVIARIMAGYAASLRVESITGTNRRGGAEATPDLIPLLGARFVRTSEPDQNTPLQEGLIKMMTGGEPIPVRANYGDQIDLDPNFKLTMSTNHKPDIRGGDDGIWRRVLLVPFDVQIPVAERDERFGETLWEEREGILRWLVEGAMAFLELGLSPPQAITAATDEYREESDPFGAFLMQACEITGNYTDSILAADLVEMFNYYLMERGMTVWKPSTFSRQFAARARQWKHPVTGLKITHSKASRIQYLGLKLTADFKRRFETAPRDSRNAITGIARDPASDPAPPEDF
ncbi:putative DNA primase/helicase [Loktanella atrilutea]|uniref:Putative DNA primase/helicase n=1 Tax=Loktanella atrilutea TaxID=366533 RepID=A0A1M5DJT9_LOKAT|nr:DNA primase family protein [Loktanella atrilutea]SHF67176.1 putative DNA primase/helicase [Loktanella atrilutea]